MILFLGVEVFGRRSWDEGLWGCGFGIGVRGQGQKVRGKRRGIRVLGLKLHSFAVLVFGVSNKNSRSEASSPTLSSIELTIFWRAFFASARGVAGSPTLTSQTLPGGQRIRTGGLDSRMQR